MGRESCRPSIRTPPVRSGGSSVGTVNGEPVAHAPARVVSDHQPFPEYGPLHAHLDFTLEQLVGALREGPRGDVYVYVVRTVDLRGRLFAQCGNSPNFQGGVVTLCACKHKMRSSPVFGRSGRPLWIAGITRPGLVDGRRCRHLFYLMYLPTTHRFASQAEMWESLPPETCQAKSAAFSPLGDLLRAAARRAPGRSRARGRELSAVLHRARPFLRRHVAEGHQRALRRAPAHAEGRP